MPDWVSDSLDFSPQRRRRRKKLGGWRQLRTGMWQYRVRGLRPSGAPFLISQTCTEAQKELVELQCKRLAEDYRAGLSSPAKRITLSKWKRDCVRSGLVWTPQNDSTWKVLKPLHSHNLESIDLLAVQKWVARVLWRGKGRPPKGMAGPGYLRHAFELLRRLIKRAVAMRVLTLVPWGDETPPSIPRYTTAHKRRDPIPESDLRKILEAAKLRSESVYIRILLSAETGVRPFELAQAKRKWLSPVEDIVGAPQISGAAILSMPGVKGGNPHDVPISADCFRRYRVWYDSLPKDARETGALVPVDRGGKWGYPRTYGGWISRDSWLSVLRDAGITDHYCAYQLRHTRLSRLANDCGPRVAQAIAGHKSVTTTERYTGSARGLVPGAFSSALDSTPLEPEPIEISSSKAKGAGRRRKADDSAPAPAPGGPSRATNMTADDIYSKLSELVDLLKKERSDRLKPLSRPVPIDDSTIRAIEPVILPVCAPKKAN
jgi:integrase